MSITVSNGRVCLTGFYKSINARFSFLYEYRVLYNAHQCNLLARPIQYFHIERKFASCAPFTHPVTCSLVSGPLNTLFFHHPHTLIAQDSSQT